MLQFARRKGGEAIATQGGFGCAFCTLEILTKMQRGASPLAGRKKNVAMTGLHPGDQLDHYRIEDLVARSGMSTIYRATDMRTGRQVAIKIPHPEIEADVGLFDRFQREAEIGEKLDHPGVMKIFGDENRSRVYMVMEWLDGQLLRHIMREKGKLPQERAIKIAIAICDVLDYIH